MFSPNLVGIYLLGSVLSTDFQPHSSDIDFLAVTRRPLNQPEGEKIQAMHRGLVRASRWERGSREAMRLAGGCVRGASWDACQGWKGRE